MSETKETPREARTRRLREIPHLQVGDMRQIAVPAQPGVGAHTDFRSATECGEEIASTLVTRDMRRTRCPRCLEAHAARLTPAQRDARIVCAESDLLDHSGHVRSGLTARARQDLVREIQVLRAANGWGPLNLAGRDPR